MDVRLRLRDAAWSIPLGINIKNFGYVRIPDHTLIDIDEVKHYPDEKIVLVTTGSQGEAMAALSRMASGIHKKVSIKPNDTIVLSSNPIPGNEKAVSRIINELSIRGANVIFQDVHVSGHALGGDQADLFAGKTEICSADTWGVPSPDRTGEGGAGAWDSKGKYFPDLYRRRAGAF